ncbi:Cilia- and flagella-associated protein 47 [Cichlidogyrus casuarinus]|uniref:Cilia- and flagella-associated protein 47 n=1 Tax=Cichlidogyrus casuarinus TaxID=1844966 RepID=A0ABD2QME6_9PLAT
MALSKALFKAIRFHLSEQEMEKRRLAQTLHSKALLAKARDILQLTTCVQQEETATLSVQIDSNWILAPEKIRVPIGNKKKSIFDLPLTLCAKKAGLLHAQIVIKSMDDIRVFKLECIAISKGCKAEMVFTAPLHQSIVQKLPIVNRTCLDWPLKVNLVGASVGFTGPSSWTAKANTTAFYPLTFRANREDQVHGELTLTNTQNGTEHKFSLTGHGLKPLSLGRIRESCVLSSAGSQKIIHVKVPNLTRRKLVFKVCSNFPKGLISSPQPEIVVLPGKTETVALSLCPKRSGTFEGIIAFVTACKTPRNCDSDGEEMPDIGTDSPRTEKRLRDLVRKDAGLLREETTETLKLNECLTSPDDDKPYRVWYEATFLVDSGDPMKTLDISCSCLDCIETEIPFDFIDQSISQLGKMQVKCLHQDLELVKVDASSFTVKFTPSFVGTDTGGVVFYHESVGEFWVRLNLISSEIKETLLPEMVCELGERMTTKLELKNPTNSAFCLTCKVEPLDLFSVSLPSAEKVRFTSAKSTGSNRSNSSKSRRMLYLPAKSSILLNLEYSPNDLGNDEEQIGSVIFASEAIGQWKFRVQGRVLIPSPKDPVIIKVDPGNAVTNLLTFKNPFNYPIVINVSLTPANYAGVVTRLNAPDCEKIFDENSSFKLLLKKCKNIELAGAKNLDIVYSFSPKEMRQYEVVCCLEICKKDSTCWLKDMKHIRWLIPIVGIPEAKLVPVKSKAHSERPEKWKNTCSDPFGFYQEPVYIVARSRTRRKYVLELQLADHVPLAGASDEMLSKQPIKLRSATKEDQQEEKEFSTNISSYTGEFQWTLVKVPQMSTQDFELLNQFLHLQLDQVKDDTETTGIVSIKMSVEFKPARSMECEAILAIRAAAGAIWKFCLNFVATEPAIDDVIRVPAKGLGQPSYIAIKLNSQAEFVHHFK